jgi:lipoyl(octanoyl) transferase
MPEVEIRVFGECKYADAHASMRQAVAELKGGHRAELWLLQHPPVFTQGQAGRAEHILAPGEIEVVQSDRGGQVTYHGPGQAVVYTLIPLKAFDLNVRQLVRMLEAVVVCLLTKRGLDAHARPDAPGVYIGDAKIASVGLRIRHGVSYHGVALNVAMDLRPFQRIHPCGYQDLAVTDLSACTQRSENVDEVGLELARTLKNRLLTG